MRWIQRAYPRRRAGEKFNGRKMTLSIGVASFRRCGDAVAINAVADEPISGEREGGPRCCRKLRKHIAVRVGHEVW